MGLATITAVDTADKKANFSIPDVLSAAALSTLADALQAYADADLRYRDFDDVTDVVGTPVHSGLESQCESKMVMELFNAPTAKTITMEIPGPKDSNFTLVPGKGDRVTTVVGAAIAAAIQTATGETTTDNKNLTS
jgi:hypothetical protein